MVSLVACESKYGIEKGTMIAGMSKDIYDKFIEMFGRDPEYQEMLDIIHEMENNRRSELPVKNLKTS
jgi:hypothetical protein